MEMAYIHPRLWFLRTSKHYGLFDLLEEAGIVGVLEVVVEDLQITMVPFTRNVMRMRKNMLCRKKIMD
jgi:hypothetical protein